ncbi:transposase [Thermomonospora amylolytica]|uniref:transposase n=1 Tax=Thermomonospora amylolytica TaxID=1411117 RepID=UPI001F1EDBF3|nr:transposase [Thermomonospora amylolytica]
MLSRTRDRALTGPPARDGTRSSSGCSACGHISRKNRPDQATFCCTSCGFAEHADVNAARSIAQRGAAGRAVSHAADDAA